MTRSLSQSVHSPIERRGAAPGPVSMCHLVSRPAHPPFTAEAPPPGCPWHPLYAPLCILCHSPNRQSQPQHRPEIWPKVEAKGREGDHPTPKGGGPAAGGPGLFRFRTIVLFPCLSSTVRLSPAQGRVRSSPDIDHYWAQAEKGGPPGARYRAGR